MKMMNHQRHCLALFLDAVPGHEVSQRLPGAGHGMHSQLFLAAVFADRSFCWAVTAYLFNSAGRQCQPCLTFALLGAGYTSHM